MKASRMLVIWQNGKSRVVTDHASSGLNNGIPKEEGKVQYDDMQPFSQPLRLARQQNSANPSYTSPMSHQLS